MTRPQEGQTLRRRRHSSALFPTPATTIIQPIPAEMKATAATCGSNLISSGFSTRPVSRDPPRVRVRTEVQLPTAPIGYVRVELGRREVGVTEDLLERAEV